MSTLTVTKDLTKEPPSSPRVRVAGFAIAARTTDKCRASLSGTLGEYHYNCPLDNQLFSFKGINGDQFKAAVQDAQSYQDVGAWLLAHGTPRTPAEITAWSDKMEAYSLMNDPQKRASFIEACTKLGLDPRKATLFDWLEADDRATFARKPE